MPDLMMTKLLTWDTSKNQGISVLVNGKWIPFTWNYAPSNKTPTKIKRSEPFPSMPAKLPGIVVATAENANAVNIAKEEEEEEWEVNQNTNLDREIPHLTSGQRDEALEEYDIGNADIVSTNRLDK